MSYLFDPERGRRRRARARDIVVHGARVTLRGPILVIGSVVGLAGGTLAARVLTNLEVGDLTG